MCNLLRYNDRLHQDYARFEFSEVSIEPKICFKVAPSNYRCFGTESDTAAVS
jgi:hypothetical protein